MGFFSNLFQRNKPKQLMQGKEEDVEKINIDERFKKNLINGKSKMIYYDPNEWAKKSEEEKSGSILLYPIESTSEILVNLILEDKEKKPIEINLLRYSMHKEVDFSGKFVKQLIIRLLNAQVEENVEQIQKIKDRNALKSLTDDSIGNFSEEGKRIIGNKTCEVVIAPRTIFVEKDEHGYMLKYEPKDEIGLMNKLIDTISNPNNLEPTKKMIEIDTYKVKDKVYSSEEEKEDALRGVINLCQLADKLGIGKEEKERREMKIGNASECIEKARKLKIIKEDMNPGQMNAAIERAVTESCIKLEDLIEEFLHSEQEEKETHDIVVYSKEEDDNAREILKQQLTKAKERFKEYVELKNSQKKEISFKDKLKNDILPVDILKMDKMSTDELEVFLNLREEILSYIKENPVNTSNEKLIIILEQASIIIENRLLYENKKDSSIVDNEILN